MSATAEHEQRLGVLQARLEELALDLERRKDSRCVFTYAYAYMTERLKEDLPGAVVADPDWIVELAEAFGRLYVTAVVAWDEDRQDVPPAWESVFKTICPTRTSPLEDLVFAMAAHIIRDLPHALVEVGMEDTDGRSHIRDYHAINTIMGETVDEMQRRIGERYAHYLRWLDRVGRAEDELLSNYGIRVSRGMAWYNATRLRDEASAESAEASIDKSPGDFIDMIMRQPLLRLLRLVVHSMRRWPAANQTQDVQTR